MRTTRLTFRRSAASAVAAVVCGVLLASPASGESLRANRVLVKPPAGTPVLSRMALAPSDLGPQARVRTQGYWGPPAGAVASYSREFRTRTVRVRGKRLVLVRNVVSLTPSLSEARKQARFSRSVLAHLDDREFLDKFSGIEPTYVRTGKAVPLLAGDEAFVSTRRIGTQVGEIRLLLIGVRVKRVIGITWVLGEPKVKLDRTDARVLARVNAKRIADGL